MARPFFGDRRASVLVLFALILPVLLAGLLGLIGISGLTTARADLQAASNAAANAVLADLNAAMQISATPDSIVVDGDKQARATNVVQSLLGGRTDISNLKTQVVTTPTTISVTVSATIQNMTGDVFFFPFSSGSATTAISWMRADQLQIVIALDSGMTFGNSILNTLFISAVKTSLTMMVDNLVAVQNYPDIALGFVPFTAQVATDPTLVIADASTDNGSFMTSLHNHFADASRNVADFILPTANAAVTACYGDPIVPKGVNGWAFGGTSAPVSKPCASSIIPLRGLRKISKPLANGAPQNEPLDAPTKRAREDLKSAFAALAPSGCRNLAMGVTWSLSQLPVDTNPKVIFMISNGKNSQSSKGKTSECSAGAGSSAATQTQLDNDFKAACQVVRDPAQNKGRMVDLIVLQVLDGSPEALKSCVGDANVSSNYFNATSLVNFIPTLSKARDRIFMAALEQTKKKNMASARQSETEDRDD